MNNHLLLSDWKLLCLPSIADDKSFADDSANVNG